MSLESKIFNNVDMLLNFLQKQIFEEKLKNKWVLYG